MNDYWTGLFYFPFWSGLPPLNIGNISLINALSPKLRSSGLKYFPDLYSFKVQGVSLNKTNVVFKPDICTEWTGASPHSPPELWAASPG